jgi:hypothetical protein
VLFETGAEDYSNLAGVQQIRYSEGNIKETFGEVLATLRREFGLNRTRPAIRRGRRSSVIDSHLDCTIVTWNALPSSVVTIRPVFIVSSPALGRLRGSALRQPSFRGRLR